MTDLLKKAVTEARLTRDTVQAQFCSDYLKSEMLRLFDEIAQLREALGLFDNRRKLAHSLRNESPHVHAFVEGIGFGIDQILKEQNK